MDLMAWLEETHGEMITKIARREHKGVRTVETEDVVQHVKLTFFQKSNGTDFTKWDRNGIADLAIKIAREYVNRERIDYMHFSCNYIYTPAMVETYLREGVWQEVEDVPDMDGRVDVMREFNELPLHYRQALFIKFGLGETIPHGDTSRRRLIARGVDRITERLNFGAQLQRVELADAH